MKRKLFMLLGVLALSLALVACGDGELVDNLPEEIVDIISPEDDDDEEVVLDFDTVEVGYGSVSLNDPYEDYTLFNFVELEPTSDIITITVGGTYVLSGDYSNIVVDVGDNDVDLVLNNATISSTSGPAINVYDADVVTISAVDGTSNLIEDTDNHPLDGEEDYNAVIYSTSDLEFNGTGTLTIDANYNNAVYTNDDIKVQDITLVVTSVDDGFVGKEYVAFSNADVTMDVSDDCIRTTQTDYPYEGFVYVESGTFDLNAGGDAIQGSVSVVIFDGDFDIYAKDNGIQAGHTVLIEGGNIEIATEADGINAGALLEINGGDLVLSVDDDGLHSDDVLTINDGTIEIINSYEGIEGYVITINGGNIEVNSTDDGVNATAGGGQAHGPETYVSDGGTLFINGGTLVVNSVGDGLDANGSITMTGGYVVVYGATTDMQSSIDFDTTFNISGGTIIALGADGMLQQLSDTSTQASLTYADMTSYNVGDTVTLTDSEGNVVLEVDAIKYYEAVTISTPDLVEGSSYTLSVGNDSLSFTVSDILTPLGSAGEGGDHNMGPGTRPGR